MVLPFLSTLSARARQAYPIIQRGVSEGLSARAIQTTLSSAGLGIRRQTLLDTVRRIKDVEGRGQRLRFIRSDRTPDPRRLPEALTTLRRSFSFRVELRGVDFGTGDPFTRFVTVALDKPLTRQEIERKAEQFILDEPKRYGIDIETVLLVHGSKAGPEGTLF